MASRVKGPPRRTAGRRAAPRARPAAPAPPEIDVRPLTPDRWPDLERLFGKNGACGGCWCMWWRQTRSQYAENRGERNRLALKALVDGGAVPGLLAYEGDVPVGWVAVQPRADYPVLSRSRTLAPVDAAPVWSVTCFFVAKGWRGKGLMRRLLDAAVAHARANGAAVVEGYPVDSRAALPAAFLYTGVPAVYEACGFEEVARRSSTRPIYRREIASRARPAARPRR